MKKVRFLIRNYCLYKRAISLRSMLGILIVDRVISSIALFFHNKDKLYPADIRLNDINNNRASVAQI